MHPLYAYIYVADKYEGLILVPAGTLLDGNPLNNFLGRELTYNPGGILHGARGITIVGTYAYITCDAGLVVISLGDPKHPSVTSIIGERFSNIRGPSRPSFATPSPATRRASRFWTSPTWPSQTGDDAAPA